MLMFPGSLGVICYNRVTIEFSMWVTKLLQVLVSYELTAYLSTFDLFLTPTTILSKGYKPDNFESHNSVKRNFTIIQNLSSNFLECEPFLKSNSPDIFALCETVLDISIDSGNFSVRGYLPLIWKNSVTHMHDLAVYVKEGLPFARDLSLKNSGDPYICVQLALLLSVSYFLFLYWSRSLSLCRVYFI